jgi:FkbM family methyltransferase
LRELRAEIDKAKQRQAPFVFVDIGANVGLFSLFVTSQAGSDARIFAVEPEPGNLRRLSFNVSVNPNSPIKIFPITLSDEAGELAVELDRRDRGGSRTRKIARSEAFASAVRVASQMLWHLLMTERVEAIDAMKINVEGFEYVILDPFFRHAPRAMWPRLVIIEDCRYSWKVDLMSIMQRSGYSIVSRSKLNLILRPAPG